MRPLHFVAIPIAILAPLAACGGSQKADASSGASHTEPSTDPPSRPSGLMNREDAGRYVVSLINYDRGKKGLPPVEWDDTAAKAGNRHAEDMTRHGFTAHVGTDGSVPEIRYTEAGGDGMVMENAGCLADGEAREVEKDPKFSADALEKIERAFMDEVPPMDGHKRNILTAWHTSVGVGLAQPKGLPLACMAQEFVDHYGSYDELPPKAKVGAKIRVKGSLHGPAKIAGIGLARIDKPTPKPPKELMKGHVYPIPKPYQTYFPKGFQTPIPVEVHGSDFSIEIPLSDHGRSGIYEVSVWAQVPQTSDLVMVSLRTIAVD
jgi:uncharacterized protein YkwD